MKAILFKMPKLFFGLFLYALGIALEIYADIGLAPWDVLNSGLTNKFPLTMGQSNILVGFLLIMLDWSFGEKIGLGTILNMVFIGIFLDLILVSNIIQTPSLFVMKISMALLGVFVISIATYFYLSVELGSGPRDGLTVAMTKRTKKPVSIVRNTIEFVVIAIGYLLGGSVGIGSLLMMMTGGYAMRIVFIFFSFDISKLNHEFIEDYFS